MADTYRKSKTVEVDPISRIEGHLGVKLTTGANGRVTRADVHGNLWRGFENFLLGRNANDAITFTQRICGVCPVPHGQTSTFAIDAVLGYSRSHITFADDTTHGIPAKAVLIRNLVLSAEYLMSHLTHFYHLVALDYVQGPYTPPWTPFFANSFYHTLLLNPGGTKILPTRSNGFSAKLWDAVVTQYVKALRIRRLTFEAGALFAGRMPMTSCFVGGGVSFDGTENLTSRCNDYRDIIREVGGFIVKEHVPVVLALGALYPNYDNLANATLLNNNYPSLWTLGNKDQVETVPNATSTRWGAGVGNFLAWGAYPQLDDSLGLPGGVKTADGVWDFKVANKDDVYNSFLGDITTGAAWTLAGDTQLPQGDRSVATNLTESIANSHYAVSSYDTAAYIYDSNKAAKPGEVKRTKPARAVGYSYIKSPRWNGYACEVGPFARMVVAGFYPVNEIGTLVGGFGSWYSIYKKSYTFTGDAAATDGLDPAMVGADLAVACVRDGIATLTIDFNFFGTPWQAAVETLLSLQAGTLPNAVAKYTVNAAILAALEAVNPSIIGAAYNLPSAVITGAVGDFVLGLKGGKSVMDRLRGRALEALYLVQQMVGVFTKGATGLATHTWTGEGWVGTLKTYTGAGVNTDDTVGSTWKSIPAPTEAMSGYGATEAPRGALAHFCSTNVQGKIVAYQCVVPTTWNASPKDAGTNPGPMEKAMENIPFDDPGAATQQGLEALRVAHTFDPCIACAVH